MLKYSNSIHLTCKAVVDKMNVFLDHVHERKNKSHRRFTRRPGIQVGIDVLLHAWETLDEAQRDAIINDFKTVVSGYQYSKEPHNGQWAPGHHTKRIGEING